ncbi:hypothetical protein CRG98_001760 [Punica granatum]|uniref:Reverse transcriptase Ty1/copia-type domain-containing protein n=1 Tax=Punica granatum TaxID=22663 RepID=A0A2I0LAY5_PUNGR|nr:hypothetical protein CRG98_001760 [Punica granatum]
MTTRSKDGTLPPPRFTISRHPFAFSVSTTLQEPQTFAHARKHSAWRAIMAEEHLALLQNHTWDLVSPSPMQNVVSCKWVYHIEQKADGTIDSYKAQLVAKRFNQRERVDYSETFSPVIKPVTIQTVLSIVVPSQWPIRQLDVKNAFFHGHLTKEDLGPLHFFLGMEACTNGTGLYLTQSKYIYDILARTSMLECKPISSPVSSKSRLSLHDGDLFQDPFLYKSVVGSLRYLSLIRSDIVYAVNQVCRFMHFPTTAHWMAVKHILRYLKGTITYDLHIRPSPISSIHGFSDTDWVGNPDDPRSISGFIVFLGSDPVSWSSKKQRTIARSSIESKYKSLANATAEILWLKSLLRELEVSQYHPPTLWCDNNNIFAIYLMTNPIFHARTKHIEIDYHFVLERFMRKQLSVRFINSDDQLVDALTKGLPFSRFADIRSKLHVAKSPFSLRRSNRED